ncbi:MAG TPA: glycosyltransferase, partial [Longimicrobiales bacterium]|nr:glycosyltransferase [Longimicrobiales bacterium]
MTGVRILHVVPYFPPDRIGGVGEVAFHLHRGLLAAGHDSHVVTVGTTKDDPTVERIAESPLGWVIKVGALGRLAAEFDVVHCHQGEALALAVAMRALRVRTPLLTTFHVSYAEFERAYRPYRIEGRLFGRSSGNWRYRAFTTRLHRITDRAVLHLADGTSFIARSSALEVLGQNHGSRARVIYNALPPLDSAPLEPCRSDGLLFVGNRSDRKRSLILPFVLKAVREHLPETRLTIVGVEPERAPALVA